MGGESDSVCCFSPLCRAGRTATKWRAWPEAFPRHSHSGRGQSLGAAGLQVSTPHPSPYALHQNLFPRVCPIKEVPVHFADFSVCFGGKNTPHPHSAMFNAFHLLSFPLQILFPDPQLEMRSHARIFPDGSFLTDALILSYIEQHLLSAAQSPKTGWIHGSSDVRSVIFRCSLNAQKAGQWNSRPKTAAQRQQVLCVSGESLIFLHK